MPILPDLLQPNLALIFCGTAASDVSAREAAYYANPTNYFWRTLSEVGIIPNPMKPQQFRDLLHHNIGLTDLAKNAQGNDAALTTDDYDAAAFIRKMEKYRPHRIAFTSKKAASVALGRPTGKITYGKQADTIADATIWVLTSPSGSARRYWDVTIWQALADDLHKAT